MNDVLKEKIVRRYIENFKKFMKEASGDRSGLRTSDITSDCLKRCYLNYKTKVEFEYDLKTQNIFFLGHCYHQIMISNIVILDNHGNWRLFNDEMDEVIYNKKDGVYNVVSKKTLDIVGIYGAEVPVKYKDLVCGRLDELYYDEEMDEIILVDKKTVSKFPKEMYKHYLKQLSYYLVMLRDTYPNLEVNKCCLLYIRNSSKYLFDVKVSELIEIDVDVVREELEGKCKVLWSYINKNEIPPASPSLYECRFCPYKERCDEYKMMFGTNDTLKLENFIKDGGEKE